MKWQFSFPWPKLLNQFWKANVIRKSIWGTMWCLDKWAKGSAGRLPLLWPEKRTKLWKGRWKLGFWREKENQLQTRAGFGSVLKLMNASKISTDLANCVKTTKVQGNERKAYAIRRPVNVTKRPVNAIKAPINAIQRPVNSTLRPVNAIQSLDECESSPDQLMPQGTAITLCNKPGVKRNFLSMFFLSQSVPLALALAERKSVFCNLVVWIDSQMN